jgi:hypothetical protein
MVKCNSVQVHCDPQGARNLSKGNLFLGSIESKEWKELVYDNDVFLLGTHTVALCKITIQKFVDIFRDDGLSGFYIKFGSSPTRGPFNENPSVRCINCPIWRARESCGECIAAPRPHRILGLDSKQIVPSLQPCLSLFLITEEPLSFYSCLTLILTSCRLYLIRMSRVPCMTFNPTPPPASQWLITTKWNTFSSFSKNLVLGCFLLPFRLETTYRCLIKTIFRKLISGWFWTYF